MKKCTFQPQTNSVASFKPSQIKKNNRYAVLLSSEDFQTNDDLIENDIVTTDM